MKPYIVFIIFYMCIIQFISVVQPNYIPLSLYPASMENLPLRQSSSAKPFVIIPSARADMPYMFKPSIGPLNGFGGSSNPAYNLGDVILPELYGTDIYRKPYMENTPSTISDLMKFLLSNNPMYSQARPVGSAGLINELGLLGGFWPTGGYEPIRGCDRIGGYVPIGGYEPVGGFGLPGGYEPFGGFRLPGVYDLIGGFGSNGAYEPPIAGLWPTGSYEAIGGLSPVISLGPNRGLGPIGSLGPIGNLETFGSSGLIKKLDEQFYENPAARLNFLKGPDYSIKDVLKNIGWGDIPTDSTGFIPSQVYSY